MLDHDPHHAAEFMSVLSPHLRAGYGLARWIMGNDQDAEDAAQDAYIRAFRHLGGWNGTNARAWLLAIVRRCCYTRLARHRTAIVELVAEDEPVEWSHATEDEPERAALRADDARLLNRAVAALPVSFREVFILRELEGLSYREIAEVLEVPSGTVMSRLARARTRLKEALRTDPSSELRPGVETKRRNPVGTPCRI